MKSLFSLLLIGTLFFSIKSFAWGGRGHASICESAVFLVQEPELKKYLQGRPQMMGHLCNIPDIYWKSLGPDVSRMGNASHFIDAEALGLSLGEIPLDYKKIIETYTGQTNKFKEGKIFSIPIEFGSNWWRADQFYRRILALEKSFKSSKFPSNTKDETDDEHPFNNAVYEMTVNMGLMGHFVGDDSQPLHLTSDYDGYKKGHGGLHSYYEEAVVAYFPGDLNARIIKRAEEIKSTATFLKPKTPLEKLRSLGETSMGDLDKIYELDPIKKKSVTHEKKGFENKKPAERESAEVGFKKFEDLILTEFARSSLLLAQLWDDSYKAIGKPDLAHYKAYKYPLSPEFVAPDYFEKSDVEKKKPKSK